MGRRRTKVRTRKAKVLRSISAPFVSNKVIGDIIDVPRDIFDYYVTKGVIEPVRKTKKDKENLEENGD